MQVIRDCVKRQLGSANQDNSFLPAHLVDRAMQYANRDPSQDPSRSPVAQQWMSPNLSPVTSALGSLPPSRSPTALPYGVSPTTPEQKFAMEVRVWWPLRSVRGPDIGLVHAERGAAEAFA